jgi:transcriptional regulator of arginine metabolism
MATLREIREKRRGALADIVMDNRSIRSQTQLQELLRERGIEATQSSISRDLRELGIHRVKGRYVLKAWQPVKDGTFPNIGGFVQRVRPSGTNLVVIVTSPGAARVVAFAIDSASMPEVVGTLSGDDTVFVATHGEEEQNVLLGIFASLLGWG